MSADKGTFYVVATPIGNLQDISQRALDILKAVDVIYAEDCRHSRKLLSAYGINTALKSHHAHNEHARIDEIIGALEQGKNLAAITDAGTPLISDPGQQTVAALRAAGMNVVPIPGACALIGALSAAGLPCQRFVFEGFMSVKDGPRERHMRSLLHENRTLIFYEAPHRILDFMRVAVRVFGESRPAVLAREVTKLHEQFIHGGLGECLATLESRPENQLGEFVVMIKGVEAVVDSEKPLVDADALLQCLAAYMPVKQAASEASKLTGLKKNALYQRLIVLNEAHKIQEN